MKFLCAAGLGLLLAIGIMGCGKAKPTLGKIAAVTATPLTTNAKLDTGSPVEVFELACNGKTNLLIVVGKVTSSDFSNSTMVSINNLQCMYVNFAVENNRCAVMIPDKGIAELLPATESAADLKAKCTGGTISLPAVKAIIERPSPYPNAPH
jgi:hypothetical protein